MRRLALICMAIAIGLLALWPRLSTALISSHDCSFCHNIHGATAFNALLNNSVTESICLSCHGPGGTSIYIVDVHTNTARSSYPAFRYTCTDCHDSHDHRVNWLGGTNKKLMGRNEDGSSGLAKVSTPNNGIQNTVFESRGTDAGEPSLHSFADNDQDANGVYDGPCEVCHTLAKNHRNNPSGNHSHNTGKTCTASCHKHITNFNRR